MPNGDVLLSTPGRLLYLLQDSNAGVDTVGVWCDCREMALCFVTVEGIATGTVEIDVSNSLTNPGTSNNGLAAQAALSANGFVGLACCPMWIKARVLTNTGGTVIVRALLRSFPAS